MHLVSPLIWFMLAQVRHGTIGRDVMMSIEMHCGFGSNSLTLHRYLRSLLSSVDTTLLQCPEDGGDAAFWEQLSAHWGLPGAAGHLPEATDAAPLPLQLAIVGTVNWQPLEEDPATRLRADVAVRVRRLSPVALPLFTPMIREMSVSLACVCSDCSP